ncbi:MAG: sigma-70 family RNA polymerase sigma factor [Candidatus Riflebacteria bacterium]|nr:sigma-70 family RNA polymerase sigma factor [Candidatus Riflebacteria bacterium]
MGDPGPMAAPVACPWTVELFRLAKDPRGGGTMGFPENLDPTSGATGAMVQSTPGAVVPPPALPDDPDQALVAAYRAGEPTALEEIVARHGDRIYRTLVLIVRDPHEAFDLAQETLLRFHATLPSYRGEVGLKGWLLKIASNLAVNRLRDHERNGAHRRLLSTDAIPEAFTGLSAPEFDPQEVVIRRMEADEVREFLVGLSPPLRAVAVLRFFEELPYEEIARILEINVGTVRSRLNAVRVAARNAFGRR